MKNKKLLLLASFAVVMTSCGAPQESVTPSVQPSETPSVQPSEQPSEAVSDQIIIDEEVRVELNRNIYVAKPGETLDISKVEVYSEKLGGFKPKTNYEVKMPTEVPNGEAYARITVGTKVTDVKFYYYESAEKAAELTHIDIPEDASSYFKESKYIKNGNLKFTAFMEDGVLYAEEADTSSGDMTVEYIDKYPLGMVYNAQKLEIHRYSNSTEAATLDSTKKTTQHLTVQVDKLDESGNPISDGEGGTVKEEKTFTASSYQAPGYSETYAYDILVDADGKIVYIGRQYYNPNDLIDLTSYQKYWAREKHYQQNPIFLFADDFSQETNPFAYEKVIPENGLWIVGYNNLGPAASIDTIYQLITGSTDTIRNEAASLQVSFVDPDVEERVLAARIQYDSSARAIRVFNPANTYQKYAYYYSIALQNQNQEQLKVRDEIYQALVFQKLPEVAAEPVLLEYYTSVTTEKLNEWIESFN